MKTVTGLFDTYSEESAAVSALEARGIPSDDISIVSNNADNSHRHEDNDNGAAEGAGTGAGIGAVVGGAGGLLTGLGIMAIPGVGEYVVFRDTEGNHNSMLQPGVEPPACKT